VFFSNLLTERFPPEEAGLQLRRRRCIIDDGQEAKMEILNYTFLSAIINTVQSPLPAGAKPVLATLPRN